MTNDHHLTGVLGLALVLRVVLPLGALTVTSPQSPLVREPDTAGYVRLAEELVATGRFAQQGRPEIERTPGYVLFLVPGVLAGHIDAVTMVMQCIFGCLTVYLTYLLALVVFERRNVALAGAALCACEPLSVLYAGKLLTETTFTCAIAALMLSFARYLGRGAWRDLLSSAVLAAAASYIRPIALYLPAVLALLLLVVRWRTTTSRRLLVRQLAVFVVIAAGLPAGWIARNHFVAGYDGFSAIGGINLYFWQAAEVEATRQGRPREDVQQEWGYFDADVFLHRHAEARGWTAAQRGVFLRTEAWRIFRSSPGTALAVHLAGIRSTLFDPGTQAFRDYFRRNDAQPAARKPAQRAARKPAPAEARPAQADVWAQLRRALTTKPLVVLLHGALQVTVLAYLALALVGVLAQGNWRRLPVVFLVVVLGYFLLLSGGPTGYHRFRLPLVPALSVFAGAGWMSLFRGLALRLVRR